MVVELNEADFEKEVLKSKDPVIVDFWASWCAPCRMMAPVFEQVSESYKSRLRFAKVNIEDNPGLAGQNSVRGIPCLIMFSKGKEVDRIVGYHTKEQLKQNINHILSKA